MKTKPAADNARWSDTPLDWARDGGHASRLLKLIHLREQRQRRRRRLASCAVAAAAVCVLLAGLAWRTTPRERGIVAGPPASRSVIVLPERRALPDGTVVELRPGAELAVNFSAGPAGPRAVTLRRGTAHFEVAKDPARPFVVTAGGVAFRAVGTAFAVEVGGQAVDLVVTEGTVAIAAPAAAAESAPQVEAGGRAVVALAPAATPALSRLSAEESASLLAWRVPRLELESTPLHEVVAALNRHTARPLALASPGLGRLQISGQLRADTPEPLLQVLRLNYGVLTADGPNGEILLRFGR